MERRIILLFGLILIVSGCIKNNPDPSWIEINEWVLEENIDSPYNAGVLTSNFTDAWVYVNDQLIGVFEVPCKVPVLVSGSANIKVFPAIHNNGISATKKMYPFVQPHEEDVQLVQNESIVINPTTKYYSNVQFWIEDFENATFKLNHTSQSSATLIIESETNGLNKYGRVLLNSSASNWEAYTNQALSFPQGSEVYLEVDYYNTNKIVTGLIAAKADGTTEDHINISMNAQDPSEVVWKKIYIDLKELIINTQGVEFVQTLQAKLAEGASEGLIRIDNIKVVHN